MHLPWAQLRARPAELDPANRPPRPVRTCDREPMHPTVLHVLATADRRGAESFALALSGELSGRGWASDAVALALGHGDNGHNVVVLGPRRLGLRSLATLRRRARAADVVVAHGSTTLPACALALARTGVPFIYVNIGDPLYWAGSRTRRWRVRRMLARADRVAAISHGSAGILMRHFGVVRGKVTRVPNGRRAADFPYAGAAGRVAARSALGFRSTADTVVYVGALSPEKRVDLAIEAVARLPGASLVVVGAGPLRAELEALAEARAPGRVLFTGQSDAPARMLAAADALVLPSDSEGLPGVLIEAGLTGIPAVVTDVGWVSEIVRDGESGFVVPRDRPDLLADRLAVAIEQRDRLGRAARAHCLEEFEMDVVVSAWEQLLTDAARCAGWRPDVRTRQLPAAP
jgi:glycosyltransferase involved in cell wall biosynthesis